MKVFHVIFSLNVGGTESMLVDILNEQIKSTDVSLIIINDEINKELLEKIDTRIKVIQLGRKSRSKNPLYLYYLNRELIASRATTIHCHTHTIIKMLLPNLWRKAILTVHSENYFANHLSKYHRIYSISKSVQRELLDRYNLPSQVVYNGICCCQISTKVEEFTLPTTFKIVMIGRLEHRIKGQDLVILALKKLKKKIKVEITLDIIGEGQSLEYLKTLVEECNLISSINFLGSKSREFIYQNICKYDILIQPSLYEGFGLTVAEALASRVPVLVSDVDGPMEIIENGKHGYYFKKGDVDDLVKQLTYIINQYDKKSLKDKVDSGYSNVYKNFDIHLTAQNYIDRYE